MPQGTGGADVISIAKRAVRAWKNGEEYSIKISSSQGSDKHRGTELLPCSGEGAEESSACSTPLRGADGSPKQPQTSDRSYGKGQCWGSSQACLQLTVVGIAVLLEVLPCLQLVS